MTSLLLTALISTQSKKIWASYGKYPPPVAPYTKSLLPSETLAVPMIFPLIGAGELGGRYNISRGNYLHTGVDIIAPKLTPIVAPFDGILGFKVQTFWIYGDNGFRCLGTHLNDDSPGTNDGKNNPDFMFAPNLRFGDHVVAGQLIGYVGNSGKATGPHLHFELFSKSGIRNPIQSLMYAQKISAPRLEIPKPDEKPEPDEERYLIAKRNYFPVNGTMYGVLIAKQYSNGKLIISTRPGYVTFTIPESVRQGLNPTEWPKDRAISIYFRREGAINKVTRVVGS